MLASTIDVHFEAISRRIGEVHGPTDAVVDGGMGHASFLEPNEKRPKSLFVGHFEGNVIQAGTASIVWSTL